MSNSTEISGDSITFKSTNGSTIGKIKATKYTNHPVIGAASIISFEGQTANSSLPIKRLHSTPTTPSYSNNTLSLDLSSSNSFHIDLSGSLSTVQLSNPSIGQSGVFVFKHTISSTYSLTWSFSAGTLEWVGGSNPTFSTESGKYDIVKFYCPTSTFIILSFFSTSSSLLIYDDVVPTKSTSTEFVVSALNNSLTAKLYIDQLPQPSLTLYRGVTYTFNLSYESNAYNVFDLSSTSDGIHNSGSSFTTGVTVSGSRGVNGVITFVVPTDAPSTLYYFDINRPNAGGSITITWQQPDSPSQANTFVLSNISGWEINNSLISAQTITLDRGTTYTFDQSHGSNAGYTLSIQDSVSGSSLGTYSGTAGVDGSLVVEITNDLSSAVTLIVTGPSTIGTASIIPSMTSSGTITLDTIGPVITTTNVLTELPLYADTTNLNSILLNQVTSDNANDTLAISSSTIDTTSAGTYSVTFSSTDVANNTTTSSHSITVLGNVLLKDTAGPTFTTTNLPASAVAGASTLYEINQSLLSNISASDTNSTLNISISSNTIDPNTAGTYSVVFSTTDLAGNTSTHTHTFTII